MSIFSDGHAAVQAFNPQAGWVFAAIFGVLLLASAIAAALKWRLHGQANATIDNLNARINAYNAMVESLNKIAVHVNKLNESINGVDAPSGVY